MTVNSNFKEGIHDHHRFKFRLDAFNWQGKEFYEALDYTCVGSYENKEDGYSEYFFLKRID